MPQSRAAGPTTDNNMSIKLQFTGFEGNSPETITFLTTISDFSFDYTNNCYSVNITIPALPKPNIAGFKGWKIVSDLSEWAIVNSEEIFTKGQVLELRCYADEINSYTLTATPVIVEGLSIGIYWDEF